jgi:hypothetical protein
MKDKAQSAPSHRWAHPAFGRGKTILYIRRTSGEGASGNAVLWHKCPELDIIADV